MPTEIINDDDEEEEDDEDDDGIPDLSMLRVRYRLMKDPFS